MTNVLELLTKNDSPLVALLAFLVIILAGVILMQWRYTSEKTVPKWIWDEIIPKVEKILEVQERLLTILDERLKK